ncbi:preprotein translocase subunit TatB [Thiomicrospira aerophila AL3]|uniref:Preprotein translocase subunit TatB n=1 Tax=Thiomicrospira aerophila AL3 TaxID=717772 RepID=W0DV44_9GAMM|nr:sulfurtransferase TusA family protein [Thiomicrospira aerophila]AHF00864.1 preprotein translocase subunit TatB [Thiomicrospira aerophila AL3]
MPSDQPHTLDLRGLKCPMPVIKTQQAARQLPDGCLIEVWVTDPAAEKDLASWCRINKHQLMSVTIFNAPEQQLAPPNWKIQLKLHKNISSS